jgi:hypothetical protein
MFLEKYNKDKPAVRQMAQRIAMSGAQVFDHSDDFAARYGAEAPDMISKGGLLAALDEVGLWATPASYGGVARDQPHGLKIEMRGI